MEGVASHLESHIDDRGSVEIRRYRTVCVRRERAALGGSLDVLAKLVLKDEERSQLTAGPVKSGARGASAE